MKKIKKKIMHRDNRGLIIDLLERKKINSITFITQKKGKVRGNHYHKKTIQWNYLVKGKILLIEKKKNKNIKKIILSEGDIVETEKNEKHAIKALKDSQFLVFTQGPRGGKDYERDTYRLTKSLVK
jgi:quercetin dioxygenase-like cupin family protein